MKEKVWGRSKSGWWSPWDTAWSIVRPRDRQQTRGRGVSWPGARITVREGPSAGECCCESLDWHYEVTIQDGDQAKWGLAEEDQGKPSPASRQPMVPAGQLSTPEQTHLFHTKYFKGIEYFPSTNLSYSACVVMKWSDPWQPWRGWLEDWLAGEWSILRPGLNIRQVPLSSHHYLYITNTHLVGLSQMNRVWTEESHDHSLHSMIWL